MNLKLATKIRFYKLLKLAKFFLVAFAAFLHSCNNNTSIDKNLVFRYNQESGLNSLDPAFARDQASTWVCQQLFNGLVGLDEDLKVIPDLANNYEILDNGTRYRFQLKTNVYFHASPFFGKNQTRKVVASDFVYSFRRILHPETASPGAWIFQGKVHPNIDSAFVAINDSTFDVKLQQPFPPFLGLLSMPYCMVVPQEVVKGLAKDFRSKPIGTGPFQLFIWDEQEQLLLHKNKIYFEKDYPKFEAIQISFIPDRQSAFLAFMQGKLDFISGVDASFKDALFEKDGSLKASFTQKIAVKRAPYLNTEYIGINTELKTLPNGAKNPFLDIRVREAFAHAFDRSSMLQYLRNNLAMPGNLGFVPPSMRGSAFSNGSATLYDPTKVKALLQAAGYNSQNPMPAITLYVTPTYVDLCTYVQQQANQLGFNIVLETVPGPTLRQLIAKGACVLFRGSWIADYPDAENYLSLFLSTNKPPNGPNYTRFENAKFDSMYFKAMQTTANEPRFEAYEALDALVAKQYPFAILYYDELIRLHNTKLVNFKTNAINQLHLKETYKQ